MKRIYLIFVFSLIVGFLFSLDVEKIKLNIKDKKPLEKIIILDKLIKENPKFVELYLLKAEIEIKERDYLSAKETLTNLLNVEQTNLKALNLLGLSYFNQNDLKNALDAFTKSIKIDKNNNFAQYFISIIDPVHTTYNQSQSDEIEAVDIETLDKSYTDSEKRDFVYLFNEKEVEILDNSKYSYTIHCVVKILSNQGANYFRELSYSYNGYEFYPEVIKAGSYDTNYNFNEINRKNIVLIDKKSSNEVSIFTNRKYVAFPIPDINGESIIEFKIKFNPTNKSLGPRIFDQFLFSGYDRFLTNSYKIKYPKELRININLKGSDINIEEKVTDTHIVKRYSVKEPEIFNLKGESLTIYDLADKITVSTFEKWDDIAKWYSPIVKNALLKSNSVKDIVTKLDLKNRTTLQKIDTLYQYVQKHINYVAIELGESALIPHTPDEIYKNKFGDCKDQAIFLIALLKEIGVEAYPVLISTSDSGQLEESVPSPYYFNHMITYIPAQNGVDSEIFCDTTSSVTELYNLPYLDQGVRVFIVKDDESGLLYKTPVIDPSKNRIEEYYNSTISSIGDGEITFREVLKGSYAEMIRYSTLGKNETEATNYMYDYQSKTYKDLKRDDIKVKGFDKQSGELVIDLKTYDKSITNVYFDGTQKINFKIQNINSLFNIPSNIKYDYVRNFLFSYKKTIEYKFPEGYRIIEGNSKNFIKENQYVKFEIGGELLSQNNFKLFFEVSFKEKFIKNSELQKILEFLSSIEREMETELVVAKDGDFDYVDFYERLTNVYPQKEIFENYIRKMALDKNSMVAKKVCKKAIERFPNEKNFYIYLADILMEENDFLEAESVLKNYLSLNDNEPIIYIYLNSIYKKLENEDKEEKNLLVAINKFGESSDLYFELVNFYNRKEEFDKSIELIKRQIDRSPKNSNYFASLGYAYSLKTDFNNAEDAFLKSIELDSKNAIALNNLAWLYCEHDIKIKEAIEYAKRAVSYEPLNDSYLDTLGEAYFKNQEWDKAIETIKKAMKINPNYTYLQQQLDKIERAKKNIQK